MNVISSWSLAKEINSKKLETIENKIAEINLIIEYYSYLLLSDLTDEEREKLVKEIEFNKKTLKNITSNIKNI